jgi:hypothetical protein
LISLPLTVEKELGTHGFFLGRKHQVITSKFSTILVQSAYGFMIGIKKNDGFMIGIEKKDHELIGFMIW